MTENREWVDGGGGGRDSELDSAGKADPPRYLDGAGGRAATASTRPRSRGENGHAGEIGNGTNQHGRVDDDNFGGEVDYTDGELGSVTSSLSGSSPLSSVGSGGLGDGRRVGGGAGAGVRKTSYNKLVDQNNGSSTRRSQNELGTQRSSGNNGVQAIPGVSARPGGVPFGASALSKTLPNTGRRPRGLRPRNSGTSGSGVHRTPSFSATAATPTSSQGGQQFGSNSSSGSNLTAGTLRRGIPGASYTEAEARAAGVLAPGVPVDVVIRAATKIESVMRVLVARGKVRRKLVSEVTAFSLIMERGIDVIKHPSSGRGKPKIATISFASRKGTMHLSWGGKNGVPLESIYGVTKGINTDALKATVDPERASNCFSVHAEERTVDLEVDNPWLVMLLVRALRLFLGAHYDTLPAPTFFSHLCLRPRTSPRSSRADSPKQTMVWTSADKAPLSPSIKEQTTRSTPTERTSRGSASDESDGSRGGRRPSPWDGQDGGEGDSDSGSSMNEVPPMEGMLFPPPPDAQAPGAQAAAAVSLPARPDVGDVYGQEEGGSEGAAERSPLGGAEEAAAVSVNAVPDAGDPKTNGEGLSAIEFDGDIFDEEGESERSSERSPGGVMALFSSGSRLSATPTSIQIQRSRSRSGMFGGATPKDMRGDSQAIPRSRSRSGISKGSRSGSAAGTPTRNAVVAGGSRGVEEEAPLTASQVLATRGMTKRLNLSKKLAANNTGPLKGRRFDLMALPMDPLQQDRRERGSSEHAEAAPKRTQGMSISIGSGYALPEEKHRVRDNEGGGQETERTAVVDDLNLKLQALRKLCVPQTRLGSFRPGRAPKTMAVKHMAFFQGATGVAKPTGRTAGGGLGSVTDMWGDGVRRQYQTDMVRQENQSVEDIHKRDSVRTAMLVNRSGVHRVSRKAVPPTSR